jgi:hypothetical protein
MKSLQQNLKPLYLFGVIFLMFGFLGVADIFPQSEKSIEEIRRIYQETNKKVAECEENGDSSSTFLTEITVNKNNGSYPAVGIYKSVVKFYYTFGDREKNPYPNRLLKVVVTTNRSAMTETSEFLFNEQGQLIFYFENNEAEKRVYFALGKPIQILEGKKKLDLKSKNAAGLSRQIAKQEQRLRAIFENSLKD